MEQGGDPDIFGGRGGLGQGWILLLCVEMELRSRVLFLLFLL